MHLYVDCYGAIKLPRRQLAYGTISQKGLLAVYPFLVHLLPVVTRGF